MNKTKRIIIRVRGGVGNQLFIYAFARYLSFNFHCSVLLETRTGFIRDHYKRKYKLNKFNIQLKVCPWYYALYYPIRHRYKKLTKFIYGNALFLDDTEFYSNPKQAFKRMQKSKIIYLDGYWQDSTFFSDIESIIKKELSIKIKVKYKNENLAKEMSLCNSIAVHIRRVNYDTVLGLDYYTNSINQMKDRINDPVFYFFSDDIKWCMKNFLDDNCYVFINNNLNNEIVDIWLMSQCKHFIIANSTFSWWGAWLSNYPDKIIIMPETAGTKALNI